MCRLQQHEDIAPQRTLTVKDTALAKFVILELYTTERSYHRLLSMIQTKYAEPMEAASKIKNPLIKPSDLPALFRHLPDMIALSEKILAHFEPNHLWRDMRPMHVGHIFRQLEHDLVTFLRYATHYQTHMKAIRRACNSVLVLKIEQESLRRHETNRMGIADYLIAPFQRVPRYCLLIKDLLKHTSPSDAQYEDLDIARKMLTGLAVAMDSCTKVSPS
ncbi:hypothetical protein DFQ28_007414 [Apophysomyces sp. BC1034]|nr:hypothetical protein DFQ28_007414 [Apophysomyces sp. BC1034]